MLGAFKLFSTAIWVPDPDWTIPKLAVVLVELVGRVGTKVQGEVFKSDVSSRWFAFIFFSPVDSVQADSALSQP